MGFDQQGLHGMFFFAREVRCIADVASVTILLSKQTQGLSGNQCLIYADRKVIINVYTANCCQH